MKSPLAPLKMFLVVSLIAGIAFIVGWRLAGDRKAPPIVKPGATPSPGVAAPFSGASGAPVVAVTGRPAGPGVVAFGPNEADEALAAAIDSLTSAQTSLGEKQAVWERLRKGGRLYDAIAALKTLAAENPNDPAVATALGEAEINQVRNLQESNGDPNEVAILALQADQNFNSALAVNPSDWEAEFDKATALAHWPAAMNKGPEVIQLLSTLLTQQETMPPQPEFAQTFVVLGEQYQAAGQGDKAAQIWQQGLAQFPLNSTLQQKLAPAPNP